MKSKISMILVAVILALGGFSVAHGGSSYMSPFNSANATSYTCRVCHTTASGGGGALVQFGTDWRSSRGTPINYSVATNSTLAPRDSDGDGFTNLAEVQAKTDPGDPASRPTTTTDTTPPTVGAVTVTPTTGTFTTAAPTITATLTDAQSAVTSCQYTTNGTAWVAGVVSGTASPWTCTGSPTGLTGSLTVNVRGTSTGGTGTGTAVTRTVDATAPTVAFSVPASSSSLTVSITTFTATDNTGGSGVNGYMVTETSTRPAATAAGWTASAPASYTFATAGAKTLYAWAKDAAGNVSTGVSAGVTITLADTTAPSVSAFTIPSTATTLTVSITTFTATDNAGGTGVNGYLVTESATAPTASTAGWTASAPRSYTFATAGAKNLYAWAKDGAGNVSTSRSAGVTITLSDTTAPTVGTVTVTPTTGAFTTAAPTITATLTDVQSPVTSCQYTTNNGTTWAAGVVSGTASPWTCTGSPTGLAGSLTINVRGTSTGGTGTGTAVNRTVDAAAPMVAFSIPASSSSLTVPITTFTATDNAGVTGYMVSESVTVPVETAAGWTVTAQASYTFATAGAKSLYAWAKDAAGNVSAGVSASVTITLPDTTAPTVTGFAISPVAGSLRVSITSFTATDDFGVTGYLVSESAARPAAGNWPASPPASYTFTTAGTKTLYAWARDAAGNVSNSMSRTVTVSGDSGADVESPEVMEFTLPLTSTSLTVPVVAFRAIDNVAPTAYLITTTPTAPSANDAGWRATPPTSYTFTSGGAKTLYGWAKDAAGNVSESVWDNVDIAVPTTSYTLNVSRAGTGSGTVTSAPSGVSCGSDCAESYVAGTQVSLAAAASSGSVFAGWSGSCTGTGTCTVTLSAARSVTATFNTASTGSGPNISAPSTHSFGEVDINASRTRTIAVANTGTATLRVTGVAKSGTDAGMFTVGNSSFTVAPGGTYNLAVTFRPTSEGTKSATLRISSNDPNRAVWQISLSGEGDD